nr:RHS repeat-associated core domain-containing protein [Flavobacterium sp. 316]
MLEENHYYPFGLKHSGYNMNNSQPNYAYKYNGKELQTELGLNMYDLGARLYDPALARFMVMDPMADFVNYQSPYVANDNNPVLYRDEYGLGILNVIGNLFRRAKKGIKRIFSGNNCNCGGKEESISGSWRREDFPKLNKTISDLFSGSGKRNKSSNNQSLVEPTFRGEEQYAVEIEEIVSNIIVPEISNYKYYIPPKDKSKKTKEPRIPVFQGRKVRANTTINLNITFMASRYLVEPTNSNLKIINDLVKTLKEYPEVKIIIEGNMLTNNADNDVVKTLEGDISVSNFKSERAKAIVKMLQNHGISPSRITTKPGDSNSMSIDAQFKY